MNSAHLLKMVAMINSMNNIIIYRIHFRAMQDWKKAKVAVTAVMRIVIAHAISECLFSFNIITFNARAAAL